MWETVAGVKKAQLFDADYHFNSIKLVHFSKERILTVKEQGTPFANQVSFETNFRMA